MSNTGLQDKVRIVTGADHGIGASTALAFARGQCIACEKDLSGPAAIPDLFDLAESAGGQVGIAVSNAAFDAPDTFLPESAHAEDRLLTGEYSLNTITARTHDAHFSVNSRAVALMMAEYAGRYMARRGRWRRTINVTTDGARFQLHNTSYAAGKHEVESFTRSAAAELGPYGITVNPMSPGAVQTGWIPVELEKEIAVGYPLRRIGRPEDTAEAAIFLALDQANWIRGRMPQVGGGNRM